MEIWGLLIIAGIVLAALALSQKGGANNKKSDQLPFKDKKPLSQREIECLNIIRKALPSCEVLAQTSFSSFLRVVEKDANKRQGAFNKIKSKRCDYLVCDDKFNPLCIVELDDSSHNKKKDIERDKIPAGAGIETIRISKPKDAKTLRHIDGKITTTMNAQVSP